MTRPKKTCPNDIAFITRRTKSRKFWLRPDRKRVVQKIIAYLLAKYANQYNISVHSVVFMSNHYHMVITDADGQRSDFLRDFHRSITRALNKLYCRTGPLWDEGRPGDMTLFGDDTVTDKMLYTWLNPVAAGLVEAASDWEHFVILPSDWGQSMTIERPSVLRADWDDFVTLTPCAPAQCITPIEQRLDVDDYQRLITQQERQFAQLRGSRPVAGMVQTYALDCDDAPTTPDVVFYRKNPRYQARCPEIRRQVRQSLSVFYKDYRLSLDAFVADKDTPFPFGSSNMRLRYQVDLLEPREHDPYVCLRL